ncbi:tryptophan synthase subunit alpha [Streptomyces sp. NPDC054866]
MSAEPTHVAGASERRFFAGRGPSDPGLALFVNAGDPGLDRLRDLVLLLDEAGVDCLELAVPFPDSVTDGPVIRRSARRALDRGTDLDAVLGFIAAVRPRLRHTKVALLADWRHSVRPVGIKEFVAKSRDCGADGVLLHGLPPRAAPGYLEAAERIGQPVVTSCYAGSDPDVLAQAARHATAYLYLVAHYGRSGTAPPPRADALRPVLATLRGSTAAPIAVGFGVRTGADVRTMGALGADAAIVGTALVDRVEQAQNAGGDLLAEVGRFVEGLRPEPVL